MRLTLIRHGEMAGDPFVRPKRPVSGCLTERGIGQAKAAAASLKDMHFDHAFSSPYGRSLQTAEIVVGDRGVPITVIDELHEWLPNRDLEDLPGTKHEEIEEQSREAYAEETWKTDRGEGCYEMYARIIPPLLKALSELGIHHRMGGYVPEESARELSIAVFAHGGSLAVLLSFLLGMRPFPIGSFSFQLTGVAKLTFKEQRGIYYPKLMLDPPHKL